MKLFGWLSGSEQEDETVQVPADDVTGAALFETLYLNSHPCTCGGRWSVVDSGITIPTAYKECLCSRCGRRKRFVFKLRGDIRK